MKNIIFICLILFVSCGKVKIGQPEKKGTRPEMRINQPLEDSVKIEGSDLDNAKRLCGILDQKDANFKTKYLAKNFTFALTYKDCNNNSYSSTPSGMLSQEGAQLVYLSGAGPGFERNEDSRSSTNFKMFCDQLTSDPQTGVVLSPSVRWIYKISGNNITIIMGEKGTNGYLPKSQTTFELAGSGDFIGMILSRIKYTKCTSNPTVTSSQNQSVTGWPSL